MLSIDFHGLGDARSSTAVPGDSRGVNGVNGVNGFSPPAVDTSHSPEENYPFEVRIRGRHDSWVAYRLSM